jgi:hypothetical protein
MYEDVDCKYKKFWVPLMWANSVLVTARKEGLIQNEWGLRMIIEVCKSADFNHVLYQSFMFFKLILFTYSRM